MDDCQWIIVMSLIWICTGRFLIMVEFSSLGKLLEFEPDYNLVAKLNKVVCKGRDIQYLELQSWDLLLLHLCLSLFF